MLAIVFMGLSSATLIRLFLYFSSFTLAYWSLLGLDLSKFMAKNKTMQMHFLLVMLAMALAYLVVGFLLSIQLI